MPYNLISHCYSLLKPLEFYFLFYIIIIIFQISNNLVSYHVSKQFGKLVSRVSKTRVLR